MGAGLWVVIPPSFRGAPPSRAFFYCWLPRGPPRQSVSLDDLSRRAERIGHLEGVPVLVIDDEADQASLNNLIRQGALSTTYHFLSRLKSVIPHHTFLQSPPTPHANFLLTL